MHDLQFAAVFGALPSGRLGQRDTHKPSAKSNAIRVPTNVDALVSSRLRQLWSRPIKRHESYKVLCSTANIVSSSHQGPENTVKTAFSFSTCIPESLYLQTLILWMQDCLLALSPDLTPENRGSIMSNTKHERESIPEHFKRLVVSLDKAGLAGTRVEKAWAAAIDTAMEKWLRRRKFVNLIDQTHIAQVRHAAVDEFWHAVKLLTSSMNPELKGIRLNGDDTFGPELYRRAAVDKFARIRFEQLFDTIIASGGSNFGLDAVKDLQSYFHDTPSARGDLATYFKTRLADEVLHSGSSTVDVLEIFMRLIDTLKEADISGIVLRRVADPVRSFLRSRDDAVRIILHSLLEPLHDENGKPRKASEEFCPAIAECMRRESKEQYQEYYEGIDLHNMDWQPEPVDAASGHQASRNLDAMAHLVTLEPRETFIQQLQGVLAARLINPPTHARPSSPSPSVQSDFMAEINLLNMFAQRFEELHIQSCEIMLRDVLTSQRLEGGIRAATQPGSLDTWTGTRHPLPDFHAKVLSRFYWPPLRNDTFALPPSIRNAADRYAAEWSARKKKRRLEWLTSQGSATLTLALADRTVTVDATTAQAAVISAFNSDNTTTPARRTVADLAAALHMDDALLRSSLAFWVSQTILTPTENDSYTVLERLPASAADAPPTPAARPAPPPAAQVKTSADILADNAALYGSFVVGMLTNQGAMPAKRILMMLRMAVPGGFPFSEEELAAFLVGLVEEGKVERAGNVWKVKR